MFNKKSTLLGAVIGIAIGLFGANAAQINSSSQQVMTNGLVEGSPIYGHIIIVSRHSNGEVYAYRQSDNLITNQGLNCMAYALFRTAITTGTAASDRNACGGGGGTATITALTAFNTVSGFRELQIGTSSVVPDATQISLIGGLTAGSAAGTAVPALSDLGSLTTGTATGVGAIVIISLSNLGVTTTQTVQEAGLFDTPMSNTVTGNMFARQTFASVAMTPGDTLAVTWQITLAHG